MQRLNTAPVPTVALVQGGCFGGGTGIVAACDVVLAADNSVFSIAEVRWGLHASIIIPQLADAIGVRQLRRYALTGERFNAEEACRIGLAHKVVPLAELEVEGARIVDHLLANGPDAIARDQGLDPALGLERSRRRRTSTRWSRATRRKRQSAEAGEGLASFAEKRAGTWQQGLTAARSVLGFQENTPGNADAAYRSPRRLAHLRHAGRARRGRAGCELRHRAIRIPLHRRAVRLRQVDPAQSDRRIPQRRPAARSASAASRSTATGSTAASCSRISRSCFPWRTALGNVTFGLEMKGVAKAEREEIARKQLALVKLEKFCDSYPHHLSGGMQQRVAIARALAYNPSVLLMDEPFAALDALTRDEMQRLLAEVWRETRKTIIYVTHNVAEAVYLADRVIVMTPHPGTVKATIDDHAAASARSAERGIP